MLFAGALKASFWFVSGLCALAAVLLAVAAARGGMAFWFERLVLTVSFSFFILDRLGSIFELHSLFDANLPPTLPWSPIVGVPLGLSMILSLARQASEARRTVVQSNEILAAELVQQNVKPEASYEAQKQLLEREVMLVERQRIVRDMHDGIGGQLLGLMMQVRGGGASPVEVEQVLRNLGGALTIDSGPDGTRLSLEVPVSATASRATAGAQAGAGPRAPPGPPIPRSWGWSGATM